MSSMLIDELPDSIEYDGSFYALRTDYRIWIMFETLMQDRLLTEEERFIAALNLCYEQIPPDAKTAIEGIMWFYSCGKKAKRSEGESSAGESRRAVYNFDQDDDYIYAAFLDQYSIDLQDMDMHWWKFKALFKGLKEDNKIIKIMGYRAIVIDSKMSDDQKQFYNEMKELYALEDNRSEADKERDFEMDLLGGL